MILTFVLVYEPIQMILEKNNMHDFDTSISSVDLQTFVATYLLPTALPSSWRSLIWRKCGIPQRRIINGSLNVTRLLLTEAQQTMGVWELIGLWLETNIIHLCMWICLS
ncbi:MAG: hypothetical protein ACLUDL_20965 [Eubacterium callanderi]|uniref:hypothetical protein n=1 Tax=Eubacterium callanderi TaxID=53442 RepID=UPI0039954F2C